MTNPSKIIAFVILLSCIPLPALKAQDLTVPDDVLASQAQRIAAIKKASASTVMVFANEAKGGGSGVLISPDG